MRCDVSAHPADLGENVQLVLAIRQLKREAQLLSDGLQSVRHEEQSARPDVGGRPLEPVLPAGDANTDRHVDATGSPQIQDVVLGVMTLQRSLVLTALARTPLSSSRLSPMESINPIDATCRLFGPD